VQAPTNITKNRRLLEAMQRSGCFFVQVGFQTGAPRLAREGGSRPEPDRELREVVRAFHDHGMLVQGFFIFGFDNEDTRIFATAESHIRQMGLETRCSTSSTPYPGTPIYDQLRKEGRLLVHERDKYGWANAVFEPARMSAEELESGSRRRTSASSASSGGGRPAGSCGGFPSSCGTPASSGSSRRRSPRVNIRPSARVAAAKAA